ncbi:hypothetical protein [Phormidesmis sp. 146-33]
MTQLVKGLPDDKTAIAHAADLLTHYSFDLGYQTVSQLTQQWLKEFPAGWVRWAVIEALYQGRYKAISVDQILQLWKRRNNPCYHFNYEFERLVCNKFPKNLNATTSERRQVKSSSFVVEVPLIAESSTGIEEPEPAWIALAEQIQSAPVEVSPVTLQVPEKAVEPLPDIATSSLAKMETLIDRASFEPTADEVTNGNVQADEPLEDHQPPIHQFTPTNAGSDFYAKLKAVADQNGDKA